MKCFITIRDEVFCFITSILPNHTEALYKEFGVFVDGYFFMPHYKLGRWDGKAHFYDKTGKTYIRLLEKIVPRLEAWGYDIELVDHRPEQATPSIKIDEFLMGNIEVFGKQFQLRPYQVDCVAAAVRHGSGFIVAGTGAGKTSITAGISHAYGSAGHRVLTIVPSSDLVDQTAEWYDLLGMDVGIYSGTEKDIDHQHTVATWQALQYNPDIIKNFTVLIWDEAHGVKATVAQKLLNESGKHIAFRFGVTGTLPKPEADLMTLEASIGPVLKTISAKWLIDNGYLSRVDIQPVELNELYIDEEFPDYASEKAFLIKSPQRMEMIADLIISKCAEYGNTMVLVNSIPFGEKLAALIKGAVFLYGASAKDVRKEHYEMFENNDDLIVIASAGIASTGISIDRIFCLMVVDPGKSFIKAIQSIGRGLRKGHDKDYVHVVDVHSKQKWALKHYKDRAKHYKEAEYPILKKQVLKVK